MIDLAPFLGARLPGGLIIEEVVLMSIPTMDAIGRPAVAQTRISQGRLQIRLRAGMNDAELSISLYHEVLEAATVWCHPPPAEVLELSEGDFERAAEEAHRRLGFASPTTLSVLLKNHGFGGH